MTDESIIRLQSGDLSVSLLKPNSPVYRRTRFNHLGFIFDLTFEGRSFARPEKDMAKQKSTGGIGLCFEYKCPLIEADSEVGQPFLKPGIGVLTRTEKPWVLTDPAEIETLPADITVAETSAVFTHLSSLVNGYQYRETRTVTVSERTVTVHTRMENLGSKRLELQEYCHNFINLGDCEFVDENTQLLLPNAVSPETIDADPMYGCSEGALWKRRAEDSFMQRHVEMRSGAPAWMLKNVNSVYTFGETDSFVPEDLKIWGTAECVCPEVYHHFAVEPGESTEWTRSWTVEGSRA